MTPDEVRREIDPLLNREEELSRHLRIVRYNILDLRSRCTHPFSHPGGYCPDCRLQANE